MPWNTGHSPISSAPLTFGVELEFVIYADRSTPDPLRRVARPAPLITAGRFNTIDAETVFQLSAEMREQGITVRKDPAGWDARMVQIPFEDQVGGEWADTEMLVWDHEEAAAQTSSDEDIEDDWGRPRPKHNENGWSVDFDSTVVPGILYGRAMEAEYDRLKGIKWKGVEVISKILTAGEEAFQEVGKVANILSKTFRTEVNRSCGLHIHVGNGDAGFDLETLKNLAGALWVFDREITRLHPRYRTSLRMPNTAASSFCGSILGRFPPKGQLTRILHKFYGAKNFSELMFWLRGSKYQAYNFSNLSAGAPANERDMKKKETIEFRQHEATLYSGRVQRWARFCVRIVQWAKDSSPDIMKQLLLDDLERQKAGNGLKLWDLVGVMLGMPDDAKAWKTFILEREKSRALRRAAKQKKKRLSTPPNSKSKTDQTPKGLGKPSPPSSEAAYPWNHFDSDDESEYGEEIGYYGTKSCKVNSKDATKPGPGSWLGHHREYDSEW